MEKNSPDLASIYRDLRPHAFAVAYRMLGTVSEAEDVVQDAFVRLHGADAAAIASPRGYLTTVVTRLCIDQLRRARVRRETYYGPWLPEPLVESDPPTGLAEAADPSSLSLAVLVLLETLSPIERAVFVLREAFHVEHDEIARTVGKTAVHCRQIATRARQHVEARRPRFESSPERLATLAQQFLTAVTSGDRVALTALLAKDAAFHGDGGGKAKAFPNPINGRDPVVKLLIGLFSKLNELGVEITPTSINGHPGAILRDREKRLINVLSFDVHSDGTIHTVRSIVNPEKLGHLGPLSDLARRS
jgi:RNA polymerase sigma-70 factor (TIGR02957 family)